MRTDTSKLCFSIIVLCLVLTSVTLATNQQGQQITLEPIAVKATYKEVQPVINHVEKVNHDEIICLAQNVYHEARGESISGMEAVAHVTLNRVKHKKFPSTICGVVKQAKYSKWWREERGKLVPLRNKCQFSWYCDGKSDEIKDQFAWEKSIIVALNVISGNSPDTTNGAMYYYNPSKADPYWKDSFKQVAMVDNHVFLR